jgi:hypothetical protein
VNRESQIVWASTVDDRPVFHVVHQHNFTILLILDTIIVNDKDIHFGLLSFRFSVSLSVPTNSIVLDSDFALPISFLHMEFPRG